MVLKALVAGCAAFASLFEPALAKQESPEAETAYESAVAARDVAPRCFSPAENGDIGETHDVLTEDAQGTNGKDRVLGEVIAVVESVSYEGQDPEEEVDHWVDE